jgi:mRNA interferase HigB
MTLLGQDVIQLAGRRNAPLRQWLTTWVATVRAAEWFSIEDVRKSYSSADGVKLRSGFVVTVFNVKGNEYRLLSRIDYDAQTVEALALLTHAEYSKEHWKKRY